SPRPAPGSGAAPRRRRAPSCCGGSTRRDAPSRRPSGRPATSPRSPPGPWPGSPAAGSAPSGAPFDGDSIQAAGDLGQAPPELQPRGLQRGPAVVGQRTADRGAIAPDHLGLGILTPLDLAFDRPDAADLLLELDLGVAVGLVDRQRRLAQVVHRPNAIETLRTIVVIPFRSSARRFIPHLSNRSWPDAQ